MGQPCNWGGVGDLARKTQTSETRWLFLGGGSTPYNDLFNTTYTLFNAPSVYAHAPKEMCDLTWFHKKRQKEAEGEAVYGSFVFILWLF